MRLVARINSDQVSSKTDVTTSSYEDFKFCIDASVHAYLNQRRCANTAPANDSFARTVTTDSRINIGVGVTAAQKWDVSVFVLSTKRPCDWGDLAGVGATAAPYPVVVS